MKILFICLTLCACSFMFPKSAYAQLPDPTNWEYEVLKTATGQYDIIFKLTLQSGWHIWSMTPGGDGTLIAPSFTFNKDANLELVGNIKEEGVMKTENMDGIEGKVNFYSDSVKYIQHFKIKGAATLKFSHDYQVCNNQMCLPPKSREFFFIIKK